MSALRGHKKHRGWKRRMRELDRWAAQHATLNLDRLRANQYQSAEIWFERWPRPFPTGVRRRIFQHLVHIHDQWLAQIRQVDVPIYLAIWFFEPGLTESQVVAAVGQPATDYRTRHAATGTPPPALYHGHPCDLSRFQWTRHRWVERELLSSYDPADHPEVLRQAHRVERADGDVTVIFEREDWLGMVPDQLRVERNQ